MENCYSNNHDCDGDMEDRVFDEEYWRGDGVDITGLGYPAFWSGIVMVLCT